MYLPPTTVLLMQFPIFRGMAACLSVMVGRSSAFIGVNAIGALLVNNCEATFYGWSILLLSAFVFTWFLPRDKDPQK